LALGLAVDLALAGVEGLEPPTPGFGDRNFVSSRANAAQHLFSASVHKPMVFGLKWPYVSNIG
jgi:hypothetical protein